MPIERAETLRDNRTLTWAVQVDGQDVSRERALGWPERDPLRRAVLEWEDLPGGEADYRGGPLRATGLAARLKMTDPDAEVAVMVREADGP